MAPRSPHAGAMHVHLRREHWTSVAVRRGFESLVLRRGSNRPMSDVSLRGRCQEGYCYGADQVMKRSFADEEGKMATFLSEGGEPLRCEVAEASGHRGSGRSRAIVAKNSASCALPWALEWNERAVKKRSLR